MNENIFNMSFLIFKPLICIICSFKNLEVTKHQDLYRNHAFRRPKLTINHKKT